MELFVMRVIERGKQPIDELPPAGFGERERCLQDFLLGPTIQYGQ
jgi:hypothetical protein